MHAHSHVSLNHTATTNISLFLRVFSNVGFVCAFPRPYTNFYNIHIIFEACFSSATHKKFLFRIVVLLLLFSKFHYTSSTCCDWTNSLTHNKLWYSTEEKKRRCRFEIRSNLFISGKRYCFNSFFVVFFFLVLYFGEIRVKNAMRMWNRCINQRFPWNQAPFQYSDITLHL